MRTVRWSRGPGQGGMGRGGFIPGQIYRLMKTHTALYSSMQLLTTSYLTATPSPFSTFVYV